MKSLFVFLGLVLITAATGIVFEPGAWYAALDKPSWTPPGWLFGPVWSALYVAIAVAGWLVWRATDSWQAPARWAWAAQLGFNAGWSWLFFGMHLMGLALLDITLMLIAIIAFSVTARRHSRWASYLFLPYAAWVSFAGALNFTIWRMNAL